MAVGVTGVVVLLMTPQRSPQGMLLAGVLLPLVAIIATVCWGLAVGLWRRSVVAHILTIVATGAFALVLVLAIGSDAFHYMLFPMMFDPGRLLAEGVMLVGGPGIILALLLMPSSRRALVAGFGGPRAPASTSHGE